MIRDTLVIWKTLLTGVWQYSQQPARHVRVTAADALVAKSCIKTIAADIILICQLFDHLAIIIFNLRSSLFGRTVGILCFLSRPFILQEKV